MISAAKTDNAGACSSLAHVIALIYVQFQVLLFHNSRLMALESCSPVRMGSASKNKFGIFDGLGVF